MPTLLSASVKQMVGRTASRGYTRIWPIMMFSSLLITKTNKPVAFSVETVLHGTVELDIIKVAQKQNRPLYCRRAYGKVKECAVYVRRGSSTAIADPEEISAMGR